MWSLLRQSPRCGCLVLASDFCVSGNESVTDSAKACDLLASCKSVISLIASFPLEYLGHLSTTYTRVDMAPTGHELRALEALQLQLKMHH